MKSPLIAYVDESGSDQRRDPGTYVLAAAISRRADTDEIRRQVLQLRLPHQSKVHWRDESVGRRSAIIAAVAALDLKLLVVVRGDRPSDRPERRRRKCLERMLFELEGLGVCDVVIESRGAADDRRDVQMLNALRGQGALANQTRLTHVVGRRAPVGT